MVDEVLSGAGFLGVQGIWKGCHKRLAIFHIYGPQEVVAKKALWSELLQIRLNSGSLWCLLGDFNVVLRQPNE